MNLNIIRANEVTEPGFYDMREKFYHADPCPEPSLSNSIAKMLLQTAPAKVKLAHPRLNPDFEPKDPSPVMLFGQACHRLLTGKGGDIDVIHYDSYRTKDAQQQKADALQLGRIPALAENYAEAQAMVERCREQLENIEDCQNAFKEGYGEIVAAARERDGVWLRGMIDWLEPRFVDGCVIIYDYKTTGESADPHVAHTHISNMAYEVQHGSYMRLMHHLLPGTKVKFRYVIQETEAPYLVSVVELLPFAQSIGAKKFSMARRKWANCLEEGVWPEYFKNIIHVGLPTWSENRWLEREEAEEDFLRANKDPHLAEILSEPEPDRSELKWGY